MKLRMVHFKRFWWKGGRWIWKPQNYYELFWTILINFFKKIAFCWSFFKWAKELESSNLGYWSIFTLFWLSAFFLDVKANMYILATAIWITNENKSDAECWNKLIIKKDGWTILYGLLDILKVRLALIYKIKLNTKYQYVFGMSFQKECKRGFNRALNCGRYSLKRSIDKIWFCKFIKWIQLFYIFKASFYFTFAYWSIVLSNLSFKLIYFWLPSIFIILILNQSNNDGQINKVSFYFNSHIN